MKTYLVGGAVRDKLLGLPIKDRDWVVTESTPEAMRQQGFAPVGKDFPVFLHPETKEEYALARTERKSGHGYSGFTFYTSPDVPIEEDLVRRDLTINAIAEDTNGQLIDPYHGQKDLENRVLRHISPAFQEDPLRILRVARFAARFHHLGFTIADETLTLMQKMVASGEASHLVAERVWQETAKALMEPSPEVYFEVLERCSALAVVLPEIHEVIQGTGNLALLQSAAKEQANDVVRFGCLFARSAGELPQIKAMAKRLKLPATFTKIATLVAQLTDETLQELNAPSAKTLMRFYESTDALRRPERFSNLLACAAFIAPDVLTKHSIEQTQFYLQTIRAITAHDFVAQGLTGKVIGERLREKRLETLNQMIKNI